MKENAPNKTISTRWRAAGMLLPALILAAPLVFSYFTEPGYHTRYQEVVWAYPWLVYGPLAAAFSFAFYCVFSTRASRNLRQLGSGIFWGFGLLAIWGIFVFFGCIIYTANIVGN